MTIYVSLQTFSFAGESEDRPPPPLRDPYVQSSVDCGRPIAPVNRQSYGRPSTTTTSLLGAVTSSS